jgi:di/tricarboxylate transporter
MNWTRVLSNVLTTIVCAMIVWGLAKPFMGPPEPHEMLTLLGGVFGFWLSYTGRLARMFRKVGR